MKQIIYGLMIFLMSALMLSACGKDDNKEEIRTGSPGEEAQGVYEGTFSRVTKGLEDLVTADGTMTIAESAESPYIVTITFACEDLNIDVARVFNITFSNDGYAFSNHISDDEGTKMSAMAGRIDAKGNVSTKFTLSQREGRKTTQYEISFVGKK